MLLFPNAKINIGLRILRRRPDGYHDIESLMIPVGWCDILEIVPAQGSRSTFTLLGEVPSDMRDTDNNLVVKGLKALERYIGRELPPLDVYLSKRIPTGAGLGGGSSDATFAIMGANRLLGLGLNESQLAAVASGVGADCAFFVYNRPMLAQGIGEILTPVDMPVLEGRGILIAKPASEAVSTREAYAGVMPRELEGGTLAAGAPFTTMPLPRVLVNDFEQSIFALRPEIARLKKHIEESGAEYCSMSGSGASVIGIYPTAKMAEEAAATINDCEIYTGSLSSGHIN